MNQFNLGNFLNRFINQQPMGPKGGQAQGAGGSEMHFKMPQSESHLIPKTMPQSAMLKGFNPAVMNNLRMNYLPNIEQSLYIKDIMHLPKEMEDVLAVLQKNTTAAKEVAELLNENISMANLAELMQKSGKEAMNKLIFTMAEASKQGLNDVSQLKEAFKLINASVSAAGQDNSAQTLKNFMLLYLPWLPLQEGVDFELEISGSDNPEDESEMSITIMISTKNYGNIKVTLILTTGNSISIFVNCSDKFPKEELTKRIAAENKKHSIQSNMSFEEKEMKLSEEATPQAKVCFSNLTEVNPFLLLMANAVIRHTIELDNLSG